MVKIELSRKREFTWSIFRSMIECLKFSRLLSVNTVVAYQRAKISSLNIVNADNSGDAQVTSISHSVSVELAK